MFARCLVSTSLSAALLLAGCSDPAPSVPEAPELRVLSGKPHLVTGGDALLEIRFAGETVPGLLLNGTPVNRPLPLFAEEGDERVYRLRVEGLERGENRVTAVAGEAEQTLVLTNYPARGPVISGARQQPYLCLDELAPEADDTPRRFAIGNGEHLDASALDEHCMLADPRVDYVYRAADDDDYRPLDDPAEPPADVAMARTGDGRNLPYVVRLETGTLNRAVYQIATLYDPVSGGPDPERPRQPASAWNGRLVYTFGGGCEAGYFQGTRTGGVLRDMMLSQGYAVASSTLNVNAQGGCNDVVSAETAMMVKEHFTEHYGVPRHTIGSGASGGAMQQLLIAGAYPGILDGLLLGMTFSDAVTYFTDAQECSGPLRRFANDPERELQDSVKAALGGWPDWTLCDESLGERPDRISPYDCPDAIPASLAYDARQRPEGIRCSIYDGMRNVFGTRAHEALPHDRPVAPTPHDNVGVQYGLEALNAGLIGKELFLSLNESIGGWDVDYQPTDSRTEGDPRAIRDAYATGRVTSGGAGLSRVPIIDDRLYLDDESNFHASVYSFTTRARLLRDNGHAGNYVIRRHDRSVSLDRENLALMDQWLEAIREEPDPASPVSEVIASRRPEGLRDDCFTSTGERIVEPARYDRDRLFDNTSGRCNALYPPHAGLRLVAGGPLSNDVLKCRLGPLDHDDYEVRFSDEEKERLEAVFPQGVCDWSQPGVGQQVNDTWLSFGPSPVNRYEPQPID